MAEPVRYVVDPAAPFPKRWLDKDARPLRVICEPSEGYVMARYKGAMPFVIAVRDLFNADRRPHRFGPFTIAPIEAKDHRGRG